jgi:hypothetical protein
MLTVCAAGGILCVLAVHLLAQDVTPVIYLSPAEAAKVKPAAETLKSAEGRNQRAITVWRSFDQIFRAAHPELGNLLFSSDFRYALARRGGAYGLGQATAVELSADDRQKGEAAYREMQESKRALDDAQKNWADTWHQLVVDHVPDTGGCFLNVTLRGGAAGKIACPWQSGIALTPDYQIAVPQ